LEALKKITYILIVNQTNQNFIWLIYISDIFPKEYLLEFKSIINSSSKIKNKIQIIFTKDMTHFTNDINNTLNIISKNYNYISVR
jgi:hypothetical protein